MLTIYSKKNNMVLLSFLFILNCNIYFYYISVFIINIVIIFNNISGFNVGIVNILQY